MITCSLRYVIDPFKLKEFEHYANEVFKSVRSGDLKIRIHEIYKLENAAQAHTDLEGRKTMGKLLLKP